jgi:hypothetical protein
LKILRKRKIAWIDDFIKKNEYFLFVRKKENNKIKIERKDPLDFK